jgi:hypothetical protein
VTIAIRGGAPVNNGVTGTAAPSVTLTGSTQPAAGDVLIIIHCNDFYLLSNMPTPTVGGSTSGVNAITNAVADGGSNLGHIKAYYYVVPSTGDLTITVSETGAHDEEKNIIVYVLSGADTSTVIDTAGNAVYTATASHGLPNISPATANAYLIAHDNSGGGADVASYTPPSGMTEQYDASNSASMGVTGASLQLSSSGPIGSLAFTPVSTVNGVVVAIAVLTASTSAPADPAGLVWQQSPGRIAPSGRWTPGPYDYAGSAPVVNATAELTQHTVVAGDPVAGLSSNAELTNHAVVTGAPTVAVSANDATAPALTVTAGAPAVGVSVPDATAPAVGHQTFDATVSTTTFLNVDAGDAATTHTTSNATVSFGAGDAGAVNTQTAGDPSPGLGYGAGAPATSHTTSPATAQVGSAAADAATGHQSFDVTATQTTAAGAGAIGHTAYDCTVSTSTAPPAFVDVGGGTSWASVGDGKASTSGLDSGGLAGALVG